MTTYAKSKSLHERIEEAAGTKLRTNFRCAANGCPNAAAIDDHGEDRPGKCFFHWRASVDEWPAITRQIREDLSMRNHGIVPVNSSKTVKDMRTAGRGPKGMRSGNGANEVTHYAEEA